VSGFDVSKVLSYGVTGLGFLLAFLAYRLLVKGNRGASIYSFMIFSLLLCGVGLASELVRNPPDFVRRWGFCRDIRKELSDASVRLDGLKRDQSESLVKLDTKSWSLETMELQILLRDIPTGQQLA
jgi:hypothetical protein